MCRVELCTILRRAKGDVVPDSISFGFGKSLNFLCSRNETIHPSTRGYYHPVFLQGLLSDEGKNLCCLNKFVDLLPHLGKADVWTKPKPSEAKEFLGRLHKAKVFNMTKYEKGVLRRRLNTT
ncbi:uncharacterized protein LOC132053221 isoform X2 [Lycium ferocissimum]|uniref:uncharacterized protein LOC132053221 isoform X2 n=1 Tax=Lycium ferocissimum TaxID=112874 RepID=UPI00281534BA|nr:uncharacterized protein LOC132053221 isoform X2 [Lycium ferocissimum]